MGGAVAIMEVMPLKYRHMIVGPGLKVDLHTGAITEGVLTFVISFSILFIMLRGPRSELAKTWLMAMSIVALIILGSAYTGPAMNPAIVSDYFVTLPKFYHFLLSESSVICIGLCILYKYISLFS